MGEYKEECIDKRTKIVFIITCIALLFRIGSVNAEWKESVDGKIFELYDLVYEKDGQIEALQSELDELKDDYEDMRYELWDIMDYLENY